MSDEKEQELTKLADDLQQMFDGLIAGLRNHSIEFQGVTSSCELAERTAANMAEMEHKANGRMQIVFNWINLKQQARYEKWAAEGEAPVVNVPLWEDEG